MFATNASFAFYFLQKFTNPYADNCNAKEL